MVADRDVGTALLRAVLATAGTVTGGTLLADVAGTAMRAPRVEDVLTVILLATGTAVAAWYAVSALAWAGCAAARLTGRRWRSAERALLRLGAPFVRRAVAAAALGVTLTGAASGVASAGTTDLPDDLGWQAPTSATPTPPPTPASPPAQPAPPHVVRPGETLWGIARDALRTTGRPAAAADVAAAWPRWYAANEHVVGPDPDLLHPGQALTAPAETTPAAQPAARVDDGGPR